jgi:hypothetical protein
LFLFITNIKLNNNDNDKKTSEYKTLDGLTQLICSRAEDFIVFITFSQMTAIFAVFSAFKNANVTKYFNRQHLSLQNCNVLGTGRIFFP